MRTTLDIDDDVLAAAKELARQQGRSAGAAISALLRQALTGAGSTAAARDQALPATVTGFRPFPPRGRIVTDAAIDALRDAEGL